MNEEIKKGCYREIGAMITRIAFAFILWMMILAIPATFGARAITRSLLNSVTFDENMIKAIAAGTAPASAFLIAVGAKKAITNHVIHAEWWNGMHSTEKAFSLLLMAFVIGMGTFSIVYWTLTK